MNPKRNAKTIREVIGLVRKECPNYHERNCLYYDCPCVMEISLFSLAEGKVLCKYCKSAILPTKPELEALFNGNIKWLRRCAACGGDFLASNNRQRFCTECSKIQRKKLEAKRQRERYARAG